MTQVALHVSLFSCLQLTERGEINVLKIAPCSTSNRFYVRIMVLLAGECGWVGQTHISKVKILNWNFSHTSCRKEKISFFFFWSCKRQEGWQCEAHLTVKERSILLWVFKNTQGPVKQIHDCHSWAACLTSAGEFVRFKSKVKNDLVWIHLREETKNIKSAHPLLIVDPPLVILLDHHLNPSLPVAALQHNRLTTWGGNTHFWTHTHKHPFERDAIITTQPISRLLCYRFFYGNCVSVSSPRSNESFFFFLITMSFYVHVN